MRGKLFYFSKKCVRIYLRKMKHPFEDDVVLFVANKRIVRETLEDLSRKRSEDIQCEDKVRNTKRMIDGRIGKWLSLILMEREDRRARSIQIFRKLRKRRRGMLSTDESEASSPKEAFDRNKHLL